MDYTKAMDAYTTLFATRQSNPDARAVIETSWDSIKQQYPLLNFENSLGDQVGVGWWPLLVDAFQKISDALRDQPVKFGVYQIKEKFGGLRFYFDLQKVRSPTGTMEDSLFKALQVKIDNLVIAAEDESIQVCEVCGQPGERRSESWVKTLCDEHHAAYRKARGLDT